MGESKRSGSGVEDVVLTFEQLSARGRFRCPACGSAWFSTIHDGSDSRRSHKVRCKDEHRTGCSWRGEYHEAVGRCGEQSEGWTCIRAREHFGPHFAEDAATGQVHEWGPRHVIHLPTPDSPSSIPTTESGESQP